MMMYKTVNEAKQSIESTKDNKLARNFMAHGYVYVLNGEYGVMYHPEDRYVSSYLPDHANIVWHAEFKGYPTETISWEQRGNHGQEDIDALKDAGFSDGQIAALLGLTDDDNA